MVALALELSNRAATTRVGGAGGGLPVGETNGVFIRADLDEIEIRDTTTPANNYKGSITGKLPQVRASTAYYTNSSNVFAVAAINTLRRDYDSRIIGGGPAYLTEDARTNVVLWSRDLTNAVWVKTNCTPLKDQTGIDGVANSASSLTATAGNATCLQTTVITSSARWQSCFIKRITGSGAIEMTQNNGTLWTPLTVTGAWTPVAIPTVTAANPIVGFRIVTSGDAVAIDMVQNENSGVMRSSPIPTTSATVTRATDQEVMPAAMIPLNPAGLAANTLYAQVQAAGLVSANILTVDDGGSNNRINMGTSSGGFSGNTRSGAATSSTLLPVATTMNKNKVAFANTTNDNAIVVNGGTPTTDNTVVMPVNLTQFVMGGSPAAGGFFGWIFTGMYLPRRMSDAETITLTAP